MTRVLLLDIDHTVACAGWRDGYFGQWERYHSLSVHDHPIPAMVAMVQSLHKDGWIVCGLTARPEKWRKVTVDWLVKHDVPFDYLLMRDDKDYRSSPEVKMGLYQTMASALPLWQEDLVVIFDDRDDTIAEFFALGVASLQVSAKSKQAAPITSEQDEGE